MTRLTSVKHTGEQIFSEFSEKNVSLMAAGVAYNAFISLVPLLVLLVVVMSVFGGGTTDRLVALAQDSLPGPIAETITDVLQGGAGYAGASVVGLVVLLWGTLKIFRGLDTAFSEIYETVDDNSFVDKLVDGIVVLAALIVAILATVAATAVFSVFAERIPYLGALTPLVLVAGLVVAFLPMYYRFPDVDLEWREVLPGTVFAAVGWALLQGLFQVYLSVTSGGPGGFFGGVIVIITWLYFSGLVLLLGAVINAVLGGHTSGKAGGVGQGVSGYRTDRETDLDRDEFALFLQRLRTEVADQHGNGDSPDYAERIGQYPRADSDVTVIEQSSEDGDTTKRAVSFRWETTDEPDETIVTPKQ